MEESAVAEGAITERDAAPSTDATQYPDAIASDASSGGEVGSPLDAGVADTGGPIDDPAVALRGVRWELACTGPSDNSRLCSHLPAGATNCPGDNRPVRRVVQFGGVAGAHYDVTLRVRGLLELARYNGGVATGGHVQIGGTAASAAINSYGISVSSPKQTLYVNADRAILGAPVSLAVLDEPMTIAIDGRATVELFATDGDCEFLRNCAQSDPCIPVVVPGIPPSPGAFDGQFAQLDVVSAVAR